MSVLVVVLDNRWLSGSIDAVVAFIRRSGEFPVRRDFAGKIAMHDGILVLRRRDLRVVFDGELLGPADEESRGLPQLRRPGRYVFWRGRFKDRSGQPMTSGAKVTAFRFWPDEKFLDWAEQTLPTGDYVVAKSQYERAARNALVDAMSAIPSLADRWRVEATLEGDEMLVAEGRPVVGPAEGTFAAIGAEPLPDTSTRGDVRPVDWHAAPLADVARFFDVNILLGPRALDAVRTFGEGLRSGSPLRIDRKPVPDGAASDRRRDTVEPDGILDINAAMDALSEIDEPRRRLELVLGTRTVS